MKKSGKTCSITIVVRIIFLDNIYVILTFFSQDYIYNAIWDKYNEQLDRIQMCWQ